MADTDLLSIEPEWDEGIDDITPVWDDEEISSPEDLSWGQKLGLRTGFAAKGMSDEQKSEFLRSRGMSPDLSKLDPTYSLTDLPIDLAEWLPTVARVSSQVAAAPITAAATGVGGIPGGMAAMGGVGAAAQLPLSLLGNKALGLPASSGMGKELAFEGAAGAVGQAMFPAANALVGAGTRLAKTAAPYVAKTAKALGKDIVETGASAAQFAAKALPYDPTEILKILKPTSSWLKLRYGGEEAQAVEATKWLHKAAPEALEGTTAAEIKGSIDAAKDNIGGWLEGLYQTLHDKPLVQPLSRDQISSYLGELVELASSKRVNVPDATKRFAQETLDDIYNTVIEPQVDPIYGTVVNADKATLGKIWGKLGTIQSEINFKVDGGTVPKQAGGVVLEAARSGLKDLLREEIPDSVVNRAIKTFASEEFSAPISPFTQNYETIKEIAKAGKTTFLEAADTAYHHLSNLSELAARAGGKEALDEMAPNTRGWISALRNWPRAIGGMTIGGVAGGGLGAKVGGLAGAAADIYAGNNSVLLRRAAQTGTLAPDIIQRVEKFGERVAISPAAKMAKKGLETFADALLSNPAMREYADRAAARFGGTSALDYLDVFSAAPEAKAQEMLDDLRANFPDSFQPEENAVPEEQKGLYYQKNIDNMFSRKISPKEAYRRANKLQSENKINW